MKTYLLVAKNELHVTSMRDNIIPSFVMREYGLIVNEIPNIPAKVPTKENYSITDETLDFHILLV